MKLAKNYTEEVGNRMVVLKSCTKHFLESVLVHKLARICLESEPLRNWQTTDEN